MYQIAGRLVRPWHGVPGQRDDMHPPYYLEEGTPRGPYYVHFWEFDTYSWTLPWRRGGTPYPLERIRKHRQALYDAGCSFVG